MVGAAGGLGCKQGLWWCRGWGLAALTDAHANLQRRQPQSGANNTQCMRTWAAAGRGRAGEARGLGCKHIGVAMSSEGSGCAGQ